MNMTLFLKRQPVYCLLALVVAFLMSPSVMAAQRHVHHEHVQKHKKQAAAKKAHAGHTPHAKSKPKVKGKVKAKPKSKGHHAKAQGKSKVQHGMASYYGNGVEGNRTANGERFKQTGLTAAHRSLPFGTRLKVTNLKNHRAVIVRVNDRGPFVKGRVIDVSSRAARDIGMAADGVAPVKLEVLGPSSRS